MSFQPFVVQCLTCGSRLRVADPAVVGTIAACPKCNSMVQIERSDEQPDGAQVAVGQSDIDSQAITEEAIAVGEPDAATGDPVHSEQRFSGSEAVDSETPSPMDSTDPMQWQSESTRRSRQIALVVAVSISGLLTAGVVFAWFVRSWRAQSVAAQPQDPSIDQPQVDSDIESPAVEDPPDATAREDAASDATPSDADEVSDSSESIDASSSDGDMTPDVDDANATPQVDPAIETPEDPIPTDLIPSSPIIPDVVPAEDEAAEETGNMQQLPPELEKYTKFLLDGGTSEKPTLEAPPTLDDVRIDAAADDGPDPLVAARPKQLNLKADLAIKIALDARGYRLADLMLLVSQITGVPIQVDWVSFDLAGVDIDQPLRVKQGWHSARELLELTAAGLGAEIREEESLVIFTLSDENFDKRLGEIADLADLGDDRQSAGEVLKDFLRGEEEPAGEELPLGVSRQQRQLAALAIEALRRMRAVQGRVSDERLRRWAHASQDESAGWAALSGGESGEQLDTPITLAGLLRRVAKGNGATCVVNWYDVNRRGAAPESLVLPYADVDAATMLDQTLGPYSLQVRQVDAGHWWVGSEATYDRLPVVVWTPRLGEARDAFVQRINSIMAGTSRDAYRLTIDQQSDRALLLLPRYIVRQLPKIAPAIASR